VVPAQKLEHGGVAEEGPLLEFRPCGEIDRRIDPISPGPLPPDHHVLKMFRAITTRPHHRTRNARLRSTALLFGLTL
jgi:hypothetical protein